MYACSRETWHGFFEGVRRLEDEPLTLHDPPLPPWFSRMIFIDSLAIGWASGSGGETDVTGAIFGVVIRVIVYTLVVYIITRMRLGKRWARMTLAMLLGVIGTLSLVIDPISWLAGGNSLSEVFKEANLLFFLIAPIRTVHLVAVIAALVLMFLPAANTYFRGSR